MRIRCKHCKYETDGVAVTSHIGKCLLKIFGAAAVTYFTGLIMGGGTKSGFDDTLAVTANISNMPCFNCHQEGEWESYPEFRSLEEGKENSLM